LENQLILPDFPASETGQKDFVKSICKLTKEIPNRKGIGFCYWGAELIAWNGNQATNGSPWENQAIFDFQNKVLPVSEEFK
jgi:arabinogalactan endo-1,4-beta-galactosidase